MSGDFLSPKQSKFGAISNLPPKRAPPSYEGRGAPTVGMNFQPKILSYCKNATGDHDGRGEGVRAPPD